VKAWAEFVLSLPSLDEIAADMTPLADLLPPDHAKRD
jgi:hypothetical protein